jgi:hypothetical protein
MRGLLNIEAAESKLITFVLFGLPDLDEVLEIDPPLKQRVATRVRLENLSREGAAQYVRHRMRLAGSNKVTFAEDGLDQVFLHTRGNPRLINAICDNALLEGFLLGREVVDRALIDAVAQDLGLVGADSLVGAGSDDATGVYEAPAPAAVVAAAAGAELDAAVAEWDEGADAAATIEAEPAAGPDDAADSLAMLDELTADETESAVDTTPADGSVDLEAMVDDEDAMLDELLSGAADEPADGEVDLAALLEDDEPAAAADDADVEALLGEFEATSAAVSSAADQSADGPDVDALLAEFEAEATGGAAVGASSGDDLDDLLSGLEEESASDEATEATGDADLDDLLAGLDDEAAVVEVTEDAGDADLDDLLAGLDDESPVVEISEDAGEDDLDALLGDLGSESGDADADDASDIDAMLDDLGAADAAPTDGDGDVDLDALLGELPGDESELDVSGLEGAGDNDDLSDLLSELEDDGGKSKAPADEQSEIDDLLNQLGDLENG